MELINSFIKSTEGYINWLWDQISISSGSLYGNYFWFLGIISMTFFLIEVILPWRKNQAVFRKDFWLDVFYMYFNFFIFYIVLFAGLQDVSFNIFNDFLTYFNIENTNILNIQDWPIFWKFALMFIIQDFTHWNVHRLLHKVPFLWQFHKVHHSVKEMGFAAHLRFHWVESIIYKAITFIPLLFIGFGITDFFYLHIFTIIWGHFNHTNMKLPLGPLKYIFNSPQMHIWHHAKEMPKTHPNGINFGLTLSVWDYIFKTNHEPFDGKDIELGFNDEETYPTSFLKQIAAGFSSKVTK